MKHRKDLLFFSTYLTASFLFGHNNILLCALVLLLIYDTYNPDNYHLSKDRMNRRLVLLRKYGKPIDYFKTFLYWSIIGTNFVFSLFEENDPRKLHKPVFLFGVPRSGTTLIHRNLVDGSAGEGTCLLAYEILITSNLLRMIVRNSLFTVQWVADMIDTKNHRIQVLKPEEEDQILLHRNANLISHMFFSKELNAKIVQEIPYQERFSWDSEDLNFYRKILQNSTPYGKRFIGKPLCSTTNIEKWGALFPDANIIIFYRHPFKVLTSIQGLMEAMGFFNQDTIENGVMLGSIVRHYQKVIAIKKNPEILGLPISNIKFVRFEDMIKAPEEKVRELLKWAELPECPKIPKRIESHVNTEKHNDIARRIMKEDIWQEICQELNYSPNKYKECQHTIGDGHQAPKYTRTEVLPETR